ncbi:MAG: hypothetical protein JWQ14_986 [Adhaeribacter sp.]|jgi:hypothetical protein|nr:hypothetical protein [Adhaeribacter sp.]
MEVNGKILFRIKVALFALVMLQLLIAHASLAATVSPKFGDKYAGPQLSVLTGPLTPGQGLELTDAAPANASDFGIVSENHSPVLSLIFFLGLLVFFSTRKHLLFPASYLHCRTLHLFRVLPNAP